MNEQKIRSRDLMLLDDIFEMGSDGAIFENGSGFVLNFSNPTFDQFFKREFDIDIRHEKYAQSGDSKANRLRFLLNTSAPQLTAKIIEELWHYREDVRLRLNKEDPIENSQNRIIKLISRLSGTTPDMGAPPMTSSSDFKPSSETLNQLAVDFIEISKLAPQPRGFAFEKFLKDLFDAYQLGGRASFRNTGEQIDGSFELIGETYLLEAKWTNSKTGATDLRSFDSKVRDKATWSRGLFISQSGFSTDGLQAFGSGKQIVCMDGLDLYELLNRGISFADVVQFKVRRAAETGKPFIPLRDLNMISTS